MPRPGWPVLVLLAACGESCRPEAPAPPPPPSAAAEPDRPGIRFQPATLRPGDTVGTLTLDSIQAQQTPVDSSWVGMARFRGELTLQGRLLPHFDPDQARTLCFEADSASAARMPRWEGDTRRPWFCFENQETARRVLGPPGDSTRVTVVVDRFTIHRGLSDQVNAARLTGIHRTLWP